MPVWYDTSAFIRALRVKVVDLVLRMGHGAAAAAYANMTCLPGLPVRRARFVFRKRYYCGGGDDTKSDERRRGEGNDERDRVFTTSIAVRLHVSVRALPIRRRVVGTHFRHTTAAGVRCNITGEISKKHRPIEKYGT